MTLLDIDVEGSVSRETLEKLRIYEALLIKWNKAINLVSTATLPVVWARHIRDSAQIVTVCGADVRTWVDLGSGGGFPGLVVAIISTEIHPERHVTLIESDQRKATFLRQVARETGTQCTVISDRIESVPPQQADVVSARALAPLGKLFGHVFQHISPKGRAVLMKGADVESELLEARKEWSFDAVLTESLTDAQAVVLNVENLRRL